MRDTRPAVTIRLDGVIDFRTAQDVTARIRAALQNGRRQIEVLFDPTTTIRSAEFLGFLAVAARHLEANGGRLVLRGAEGKNRSLLSISRLDGLIDG